MSQGSTANAQLVRMRQLVFPREHGAWGMLLVPLATGAYIGIVSGGSAVQVAYFAVLSVAVLCLRTPVESLLGTSGMRVVTRQERHTTARFTVVFGSTALVATTFLLWGGRNRALLALGAAAGLLFGAQVLVKRMGRRTRMLSQVIGALALTATAPGAYYAATGQVDVRGLGLWFANWIFAGNQIHFVQLRLHAAKCGTLEEKFARGRLFFAGQIVMMLALASGWAVGIVPALVLLAFMPAFVRGTIWFFSPAQPLALHRLGISELAYSLAFGTLLIVGLH